LGAHAWGSEKGLAVGDCRGRGRMAEGVSWYAGKKERWEEAQMREKNKTGRAAVGTRNARKKGGSQ